MLEAGETHKNPTPGGPTNLGSACSYYRQLSNEQFTVSNNGKTLSKTGQIRKEEKLRM